MELAMTVSAGLAPVVLSMASTHCCTRAFSFFVHDLSPFKSHLQNVNDSLLHL